MKNSEKELKWAWATVIVVVLTLLMCLMCGCKTKKESTVDFRINSSTAVQENVSESQQEKVNVEKIVIYDTVREIVRQQGQIDIERDTAGRALRIIYEHLFSGFQTQGSSRIDTVFSKEVIMVRDSTATDRTDAEAEGTVKEKKTVGFTTAWVVGFWVLVGMCVVILPMVIRKWVMAWKK